MLDKSPKISVIVPTYNRPELLQRALKSISDQSYKNIETIVVDDASKVNIKLVVDEFSDVKYVKHSQNKGAAAARNTGIKQAEGDYIAFLDSDDEWLPQKLEDQISHMSDTGHEVNFCNYYSCLENYLLLQEYSSDGNNHRSEMLRGNLGAITSTLIFDAEAIGSHRFDTQLPSFQEYDFLLRVSKESSVGHLPTPLAITHHHDENGISYDPKKREAGAKIFFDKWKREIISEHGSDGYSYFYKSRFVGIHALYAKYYCKRGKKLKSITELFKSFRHDPFDYRTVDGTISLLFGSRSADRLKYLYFRLFNDGHYSKKSG